MINGGLQIKFEPSEREDDDGGLYRARSVVKFESHYREKVKIPIRGVGSTLLESLEDLDKGIRLAYELMEHQS